MCERDAHRNVFPPPRLKARLENKRLESAENI